MGPYLPTDLESWIGWLTFLPIVLSSIAGFALTLSKWVQLRRPNLPTPTFRAHLQRLILSGHFEQARSLGQQDTARGSRLAVGLLRHAGRPREVLKERGQHLGQQLAAELEYGLGGLALIATLGPLFGLFGTVVGIVMVFNKLAVVEGFASPQQLAVGIGTALYTTVAGLIVGVLALVFHRYLSARVDRAVAALEAFCLELVDPLSKDGT